MTTRPERTNPMLAAALRYALANWPVFPCIPGEKVPATRHGFLDATTDPGQDHLVVVAQSGPQRRHRHRTSRARRPRR